MVRRIVVALIALVLLVFLGGVAWLYAAAKRAEPSYSGEIRLSGLTEPVRVRYGPHAVPSVEAASLEDLLFAQGFLVAAERMWQMDLLRRLAAGRLAELFGEEALPADRFFRTMGLARAAKASLEALEEPYRRFLAAYAAGVNAYRAHARRRLPLEYLIAGVEPAEWRPEDSLVIGEYLGWSLSFNAREELVFLRLAARVGMEKARELFPTDEGLPAPPLPPDLPALTGSLLQNVTAFAREPARWGLPWAGAASNAWAVDGGRTAAGHAMLANDPHLAPTMPGIWYELELRAPGFHVAGVALPGVPFVVIGHNADLAWGFTTTIADTQNIFIERPTADSASVERPGGESEPIRLRTESLMVKGRAAPEELDVRSTSHGVVINDILGANTKTPMDLAQMATDNLLVLRTSLEIPERALVALHRLNIATTVTEARAAVLEFKHAAQTLSVAHRNGDIAWQMSGAIPLRQRGSGAFPVPGWKAGYGWQGYASSERNPSSVNPPAGFFVNANHRPVSVDYPLNLGHAWMSPYRARRATELLETQPSISAQAMAEMQLDRVSVQARRVKAALERVRRDLQALDPEAWRIAVTELIPWNGGFDATSREATFSVLLESAFFEALFGDELEEDLPALLAIATVSYNALEEVMYSGRSSFWDDVRTAEQEGPAHIWARALREAQDGLEQIAAGGEPPTLEQVRHVRFPHAFDRIPLLGPLFSVGPFGVGGDGHTVNVSKASPAEPGETLFIPTLRVVYLPADWTATRGTLTLGQSGHRLSPYRTDQLEDWRDGGTHAWLWNGPTPGEEIGTLRLEPAR